MGTFFPNFLIGLREGLEAALVVSIIVACLVRAKRTDRLRLVWLGVGAAVAVSAAIGAALTYVWGEVDTFKQQELMGGTLSILAVAFVTWMIFWMRRTARTLKKEITSKLEEALRLGPLAIVVASFLAVAREGIETTFFFWSSASRAESFSWPLAAFVAGIAVAVVLGYLIYRSAIKINLSKFFTYTGVGLIVVAAGILAYGIHDLQEAEYLPGLNDKAFDISETWDETAWYGALAKGIVNFQAAPTVLQVIVWSTYLAAVMTMFLWPSAGTAKPAAKPPAADATSAADTPTAATDAAKDTSTRAEPTSSTSDNTVDAPAPATKA